MVTRTGNGPARSFAPFDGHRLPALGLDRWAGGRSRRSPKPVTRAVSVEAMRSGADVHAKSAIMLGRAQTSRHRQRINIRGQRCDQRTPHASALPTNVTFSSSYAQIKRSRHCCHSRPRQPRKTCLLVAKCGRGSHTREYRRRVILQFETGRIRLHPFPDELARAGTAMLSAFCGWPVDGLASG
jgi:hypothetical protein